MNELPREVGPSTSLRVNKGFVGFSYSPTGTLLYDKPLITFLPVLSRVVENKEKTGDGSPAKNSREGNLSGVRIGPPANHRRQYPISDVPEDHNGCKDLQHLIVS